MDEPQVTSQIDDSDARADKSDLNEVLDSAFGSDELEKAMDVEEIALTDAPSTSAETPVAVAASESLEPPEKPSAEPVDENAGDSLEVSMVEITVEQPNESVEQINLDKPIDDLDETAQSALDVTDALSFAEQSINISQLDVVEHHDDSNDAFNALKESETDALQMPKEEDISEHKDGDEEKDAPEPSAAGESEEPTEKEDEPTEIPMETEDAETSTIENADESTALADETAEDSHEIGTETVDLDDDDNFIAPGSVDKPDGDDVEETLEGENL